MTALWITLGLAGAVGLMLMLRAHICLEYGDGQFRCYLKFGPIHWSLLADTPEKKAEAQARMDRLRHEAGRGDSAFDKTINLVHYYWGQVKVFWALLPVLGRTVKADRFQLHVLLTDDDPADLALHYGQSMALLSSIVAFAANILPLDHVDVDTQCAPGKTSCAFMGNIRLTTTLAQALRIFYHYLKNQSADKKANTDAAL